MVREVAAQIARTNTDERTDEIGEPEQSLVRPQLLDRPDTDEAPDRRAGQRPGEVDRKDRPQSSIRVRAEDHAIERCQWPRSEEHTSELQSLAYLVCR